VRVAAGGRARLESPADGAIFALDPDIPATRQRIVLRARGAGEGDRFLLPDGRQVPAGEPYIWAPAHGHQAVTLVAADGRVLDRAAIDVR
jgi:penicillin-binding protein 1C